MGLGRIPCVRLMAHRHFLGRWMRWMRWVGITHGDLWFLMGYGWMAGRVISLCLRDTLVHNPLFLDRMLRSLGLGLWMLRMLWMLWMLWML